MTEPSEPTSITRARYQVAFQRTSASDEARRRMRHRRRRSLWPPGFITPKWAMAADMKYCVGSKDSGECYLVKKDFEFDGASVPFLLTRFVPRTHSAYLGAAALHDFLYRECRDTVPRNRADQIFREAMLVLGLHWFWAMLLWRGVRAGGWMVWYRGQPETPVGKFLTYGRLSYPFGALWILVLGVVGFSLDLLNLGTYRREAAAVAAQDHG